MQLKTRFLSAIINGELGTRTEQGMTVSLKQFKRYFHDINPNYISAFLPATVIETGQHHITATRYTYRIRYGVYLIHPDAIKEHRQRMQAEQHAQQ